MTTRRLKLRYILYCAICIFVLKVLIQEVLKPKYAIDKCISGEYANSFIEIVSEEKGERHILHCLPQSPKIKSPSLYVIRLNDTLTERFLQIPKAKNFTEKVVILSPVRDAVDFLDQFGYLLSTISYPHNLISVHFGEDGSTDDTVFVAKRVCDRLINEFGFRKCTIYTMKIKGNKTTRKSRHDAKHQISRRSHMGKARNLLSNYGLEEEAWVLWIDSDVISFRPDIIQQFLYSDKDVMAASCLFERKLFLSRFIDVRNYDLNTFRETVVGDTQYRIWLKDLKSEGREARIDYVGACALMVRADAVRKGLKFTEGPYHPQYLKSGNPEAKIEVQLNIETEGLAKMAREMDLDVFGLPFLEVYHI
ncbi:uncharacterized protein LOC123532145 [Mercenaria mercenaria]|uniref:uncharacterized protein LOC123532145 n=1 Tax=Mercenaria mercenaria TaxID=6596 RepID=UPI00234F0474|nr:uncharacterized protein LOC123532145 [Mercenaria mercenaria]